MLLASAFDPLETSAAIDAASLILPPSVVLCWCFKEPPLTPDLTDMSEAPLIDLGGATWSSISRSAYETAENTMPVITCFIIEITHGMLL